MSSPAAVVTLAPLQQGTPTDFTSSTVSIWLQIAFQAGGYYESGGLPAGVAAYASSIGINVNSFLQAIITSETDNDSNAIQYSYKYVPSSDSIMILGPTGELASSAGIPTAVAQDTIVGHFIFNRL
jgi:hypothetical protein